MSAVAGDFHTLFLRNRWGCLAAVTCSAAHTSTMMVFMDLHAPWSCRLVQNKCHLPASRWSSWEPHGITQVYIPVTLLPLMLLHEIFVQAEASIKRCVSGWKTNKSLNSEYICKKCCPFQINQKRARFSTGINAVNVDHRYRGFQVNWAILLLNSKVLSGAN